MRSVPVLACLAIMLLAVPSLAQDRPSPPAKDAALPAKRPERNAERVRGTSVWMVRPEGFDVATYLDTHIELYLHGIANS